MGRRRDRSRAGRAPRPGRAGRRRGVVAAGGADLGHDDVPAVLVLRDGGPFAENPGRLEVCLRAREGRRAHGRVGQTDMQVGRGPGVRRSDRGGGLQRLLVQPAGTTRPARGDPHVGEHHRAVQLVDEVARGMQAADRIGEGGQCLLDVPGRPGGQAEVAAAGATDEMVLRSGQVQGVPGMADGAGDVAAGLGQRRTVDRDRRRRRPQVLGVGPGRREVRVLGAGGQRRFGVVEPRLGRVEVAGHQQRPAGDDAEDRAAANHRLRQGPHPVISRLSCRARRNSGSASSIR